MTTRLARFVTVGVGAAALLFLLTWLFAHVGLPPFGGAVLAYGLAFATAYSAQRWWTFGAQNDHHRALPRYLAVQASCALLSGLAAGALDHIGMAPVLVAALTTAVASAASYLLSLHWVFPQTPSRP